jgi:putative transposase
VRYAWIERHRDDYTVARMCRQLDVSHTGYLQWRKRRPSDRATANAALDAEVAAIHARGRQSYGRPRIVRVLHAQGVTVGHERVRRSLLRQALRPVYRKPYRVTTDSAHTKLLVANVLNRRFAGWQINRAWVADLTYIRTDEGWLYLACILDLGSRRVVGWSMSERLKAQSVCDALKMAYWRRKPLPGLMMHSDRGVQYAATPEVDCSISHAAIDESQGQLLGQRADGKFFQDTESRMGRSHAICNTCTGPTRFD